MNKLVGLNVPSPCLSFSLFEKNYKATTTSISNLILILNFNKLNFFVLQVFDLMERMMRSSRITLDSKLLVRKLNWLVTSFIHELLSQAEHQSSTHDMVNLKKLFCFCCCWWTGNEKPCFYVVDDGIRLAKPLKSGLYFVVVNWQIF